MKLAHLGKVLFRFHHLFSSLVQVLEGNTTNTLFPQIRIFVNQIYKPEVVRNLQENPDLLAIRFASLNPILNPWVYILCRRKLLPYVTHMFRQLLCKFDEGSRNEATSQIAHRRKREATTELRASIHWMPTLSKPIFHGNNANIRTDKSEAIASPSILFCVRGVIIISTQGLAGWPRPEMYAQSPLSCLT
uniref:Uncharacterized protein n=1 Tax=Eptatretus burgeri TaxID=7764 RepID=A0A8C4QF32_EPTBU